MVAVTTRVLAQPLKSKQGDGHGGRGKRSHDTDGSTQEKEEGENCTAETRIHVRAGVGGASTQTSGRHPKTMGRQGIETGRHHLQRQAPP